MTYAPAGVGMSGSLFSDYSQAERSVWPVGVRTTVICLRPCTRLAVEMVTVILKEK
jgi:hypothetical protein